MKLIGRMIGYVIFLPLRHENKIDDYLCTMEYADD
jgi:hypothetical protein